MGKIVASYLVRITLREPEDLGEGEQVQPAPTLDALARYVATALEDNQANDVNVTAERVDR